MKTTQRRSRGTSNRPLSTEPSMAALTTSPPSRAAAALSGCPSISVASSSIRRWLETFAGEHVAGHDPGHGRRGRRPETAGQRDPVAHRDPPADAVGERSAQLDQGRLEPRTNRLSRSSLSSPTPSPSTSSSIRRRSSSGPPARSGRSGPGPGPGSRSRRRGSPWWPAPPPPSGARRARPASSWSASGYQPRAVTTAPVVAAASMNPPAWASAVVGSLSPLPVRTQTTWPPRQTEPALGRQPPDAGQPGRRRRLAEDALVAGDVAIGLEDLVVGDRLDPTARFVAGGDRLRPAGRVADPDRRGDRLRLGDRVAQHDRRGAGRLEAEHPGQPVDRARPPGSRGSRPSRR